MTRQDAINIKDYFTNLVRGQVYICIVDDKLIIDINLPCHYFHDVLECNTIDSMGGSCYAIAQISYHIWKQSERSILSKYSHFVHILFIFT